MHDRNGAFFFGLLLGAAIGASLGLLFAPESGEAMRQRVKERTSDYKERASAKGSEWLEKGKQTLKEKKERIAASLRGEREEEEAEEA